MKKTTTAAALRHPARLAGSSLLRMQSDERLAELAAAGHEAAFDAIVVRYRSALLRYCGAIVGSSRAEDAVQQTLLNAHAALGDLDEVRHLRSWLYRIAHNVSLNVLRGVRDDVSLDADGAEGLRLPPALSSSESFEASEQFRATVAALQALPERQRAALVLRELEGRSHEEIASALGVSAGSARQHLMRARVAMRGAVTAVTPWGLIVRIADLASAGGGAPGGLETAAGAGLGAGLAKVTAGVMATGALVGGAAVGTHEVVRHDGAAPAQADVVRTTRSATTRRAAMTPETPISLTAPRTRTTSRNATTESEHRGRGRDDASGDDDRHGRRAHGSDDASSHHSRTSSPLADDHGHHRGRGRGGDDDQNGKHSSRPGSGSGRSGSGSSDDDAGSHSGSSRSGSGRSGSGSSGSGSSGSGRSGSGSDDSGSGSSGGSSGSGKGKSSDDSTSTLSLTTSGSTGSSGSSGSGSGSSDASDSSGSGSGGSGSDDSSGSGKPSDDD